MYIICLKCVYTEWVPEEPRLLSPGGGGHKVHGGGSVGRAEREQLGRLLNYRAVREHRARRPFWVAADGARGVRCKTRMARACAQPVRHPEIMVEAS